MYVPHAVTNLTPRVQLSYIPYRLSYLTNMPKDPSSTTYRFHTNSCGYHKSTSLTPQKTDLDMSSPSIGKLGDCRIVITEIEVPHPFDPSYQ
jgi:hypothetical protein